MFSHHFGATAILLLARLPLAYGDIGVQISGQDRGQTQKKLATYPAGALVVKLDAYDVIVGGN
jgi:hypothetical protein